MFYDSHTLCLYLLVLPLCEPLFSKLKCQHRGRCDPKVLNSGASTVNSCIYLKKTPKMSNNTKFLHSIKRVHDLKVSLRKQLF